MKSSQRLCENCHKRPAKYWSQKRKTVLSRPDHVLCSKCYCSLLDKMRKKDKAATVPRIA